MSSHNHHTHFSICAHRRIKLCADCNVVYCASCKYEWAARCMRSHYFSTYGYNTIPFVGTGLGSSPTWTISSVSEPVSTADVTICKHSS